MKLVIFTDLDGTLLDDSYSFAPALPAIEIIRAKGIPLVLCSSKTRPEIEYYRTRLFNTDPFITENGGAIYIPKGYFHQAAARSSIRPSLEYTIISFGERYGNLRQELLRLRAKGFPLRGFGDMTPSEVSQLTGLNRKEAILAKQREYDEPFVLESNETELKAVAEFVRRDGFSCLEGGILSHLVRGNDKGKATRTMVDLYRREFGKIITAALGDGPNDVPMLKAVDHAIVVPKRDGSIDPRIRGLGFAEANDPGPLGWNRAVLNFIANIGPSSP